MAETLMRIATQTGKALTRRFTFTRSKLDALTVPPGRDRITIYDTAVPRLSYMLTRTGAASFYITFKLAGRMRRYRIGDGTLAVEQARRLSAAPLAMIATGIDPQERKQRARAEESFGAVWEWFMRTHARPRLRTADELQEKYDLSLVQWAGRKFNTITRNDVAKLHQKIGEKSPGAANRLVQLLSSLFNRARDLGFDHPNPASGIRRFPENRRERYLLPDELPRFHAALQAASPSMRDLFELLLFTGARSGNVKGMEWNEIDLTAGTWSIPAAKFKTGKPVTVPLVRQATDILTRRKQTAGGNAFVFPAVDAESGHVERPEVAWKALCKLAGLKDLRIHDLRHSLASWQAASGVSLPIIGRGLGHASTATTARYAHIHLDPVRAAMSAAVDAMTATASRK